MKNVFMSSPLDTYDPAEGYPGGIHPRYLDLKELFTKFTKGTMH